MASGSGSSPGTPGGFVAQSDEGSVRVIGILVAWEGEQCLLAVPEDAGICVGIVQVEGSINGEVPLGFTRVIGADAVWGPSGFQWQQAVKLSTPLSTRDMMRIFYANDAAEITAISMEEELSSEQKRSRELEEQVRLLKAKVPGKNTVAWESRLGAMRSEPLEEDECWGHGDQPRDAQAIRLTDLAAEMRGSWGPGVSVGDANLVRGSSMPVAGKPAMESPGARGDSVFENMENAFGGWERQARERVKEATARFAPPKVVPKTDMDAMFQSLRGVQSSGDPMQTMLMMMLMKQMEGGRGGSGDGSTSTAAKSVANMKKGARPHFVPARSDHRGGLFRGSEIGVGGLAMAKVGPFIT